jgi:hypothetical protein
MLILLSHGAVLATPLVRTSGSFRYLRGLAVGVYSKFKIVNALGNLYLL